MIVAGWYVIWHLVDDIQSIASLIVKRAYGAWTISQIFCPISSSPYLITLFVGPTYIWTVAKTNRLDN